MKKSYILFFIFCWLFVPWGVFAQQISDFQRKLSCKVSENAVRVYLLQESETLKCQDYLSILNRHLKAEYQTMLQIQSNLNRWDDVGYRNSLYESKKSQFLKLFAKRRMIQTAVNEFEAELLSKSKGFLGPTLLEKQKKLQEVRNQIEQSQEMTSSMKKSLTELKSKQEVITKLLSSETMDTFIKQFTVYLTLFPIAQWWK